MVALDFTPNPAHAPIFLAAREHFDRLHALRSNREAAQARTRAGTQPMA